jgi:glucose-induced degradation protein 8
MEAKKNISVEEWERRLEKISIDKRYYIILFCFVLKLIMFRDIDRLILNYLVIEGFKEAAEEFIRESGLDEFEEVKRLDLDSIEYRLNVRQAIQSGKIDTAITELNNYDPDILDGNPEVYFHLKLQEFLEKIKSFQGHRSSTSSSGLDIDQIMEVIEFARENLAPIAQEQAGGRFLEEVEDAMGLLATEMGAQWPTQGLLDPEHRLKTAKEVNSAILASQSQPQLSKLPEIMALLQWAQSKMEERVIFPKLIDPANGIFENVSENAI